MKYSLTGEQRSFFERKHYIEFEGLFSEIECAKLVDEIQKVLQIRLLKRDPAIKKRAKSVQLSPLVEDKSDDDIFLLGRDTVRESSEVEHIL